MPDKMDSLPTAEMYWQDAKKIRHKIVRDIRQLKEGSNGKTEEEQLRSLEGSMAEFRLRFVCTLSGDPQYIYQSDAEKVMWELHTYVNQAYRDLFNERLRGQPHVVTKRKVEKLYNNYLKTAHDFYKGYFQRLQSLHGLPQLPRINSVLELEPPTVDDRQGHLVTAEAAQRSFHSTLLRLGDISRWRHKARPKPGGTKMALLYYALAHDLKPTSGDAHHQMGMMYTEEHNHLLVVYHLYRSLAIEFPHANSTRNLEVEFKHILNSSTPTRRTGTPDPNESFSNWFVRLHAHFAKGETFSQQSELEQTVLHRLEEMLKKPDTLPLVLKMVLINIAAYYVTLSRALKDWKDSASKSCEFVLGMNVRWIVVISRLFQAELQEFSKAAAPAKDTAENGAKAKHAAKFSPFTENLLPLMRVYMAWLYIYRADIVKFQGHLGGHVFDMYRILAQVLTTILKEFNGQQMEASPYLLPEDVVALGMKPFDGPNMASACRLHLAFGRDDFKPHWEDTGLPRKEPDAEMRARVYDLMNCGFSLALDDGFPLAVNPPAEGSDGTVTISYVEGGKGSQIAQQEPVRSQPIPADAQAVGNLGRAHTRAPSGSAAVEGSPEPRTIDVEPLETESDLNIDAKMHDMVDDLLEDDNSDLMGTQPGRGPTQPKTSSYGMHSSTAEQVFGGLQTPGHNSSAIFGRPTPWGSFENAGAYEIASGGHVPGQINNARSKAVSSPLGFNMGSNPFSMDFSQAASGLPPVNSPFGLPTGQINGGFAQSDMYSYNQQFGGSFPAYAQPNGPTTVCNGNVYNATTAYGRGVVAAKDDPSRFRNAVKKTHMAVAAAEADAFDRAVLESALADDRPKPKG
ncbi:hypothetical protein KVR01_008515 [Diaporthe batatas]|uniref:uncharacterized protein n=1 Tax=Diaporthe batatas TaxID=748121 RepID=UPI001D055274|nr:uncharacterized protein KVR01_008515 [Diaporthe batatas]KAG8161528.1 hypothetical protein KVR01_008515 [Diaporthe batatas]